MTLWKKGKKGTDLFFAFRQSHMLPRVFLEHFCDTSLVIEKDNSLIAFLIGFLSQYRTEEAYIHFAGVHPEFRGFGIGAYLYNRFSKICTDNGRSIIKACTSPVNTASINFHQKMGFQIEKGNSEVDGIQVTLGYNKPHDHKVLFKKNTTFFPGRRIKKP
ncbi:MAG: GNAT family N-acetyltransferase [Desulfobacteraceae bacterium]|nr:GNAT family N-acetyltransferase [Desulfobacteraceae bacterium]